MNNGTVPAADNGGNYVLPLGSETGALLTKIDADTETIEWEIAGENIRTKHPVYVIGGSMDAQNNFHTLLHIGCNAAKGLSPSQQEEIFGSIWKQFETLEVKRIDSSVSLKYYGNGWNTSGNSVSLLLAQQDGQCLAWAKALYETARIQGVVSEITIINYDYLDLLYDDEYLGFLQTTNSAQGGRIDLNDSEHFFHWHAIVKYNGRYYDPSIGKSADSLQDYLHENIKFYWRSAETGAIYSTSL